MFSVDGIGCVIRECREDVLLGMIKFWSVWSRVPGRPSRSPVLGRTNDEWLFNEGPILTGSVLMNPTRKGRIEIRLGIGCFEYA
jgi:hypothetical protein